MKIGIITLPLHVNFGGLLQNYALQQILVRMGHEPITLNQRIIPKSAFPQMMRVIRANIHTFGLSLIGKKCNRRYVHYHGTSMRPLLWRNSKYFYDSYISHTCPMDPNKDYRGVCERLGLDALIVGSDQVWRPRYVENLSTVYLGFEHDPNIKKVAYAVSFGTADWEYTRKQTKECARLAQLFDLITVRELSGKGQVNSFLSSNAEVVLDPTLLLDKEDYIKIVETEGEPESDGSLFCYILDQGEKKEQLIRNIEESSGLKSFFVNVSEDIRPYTEKFIMEHLDQFYNQSVTKWLRGFMDAEMVITDSFHAVAFSIIFNKPFWVIGNPGRGMARFESLLSIFGLQNRMICFDTLKYTTDTSTPIDWVYVNKVRNEWKTKSLRLLKEVLENHDKHPIDISHCSHL